MNPPEERLCEGRVCIVTGAGRGIGLEHALMLSDHGALLVVNDLGSSLDGAGSQAGPAQQVAEEIVARGGQAVANTADIATWAGAQGIIEQAVDTFGRLDVVINNAGILRDGLLANMSEDDWDAVVRVHLKGTFAPSRHAASYWRSQSKKGDTNDARIINTTSVSGLYGNVGQANYGAAKAGIAAFTLIVAQELARYGVTVNAIAPAGLTRMTSGFDLTEEAKQRLDPRWSSAMVTWLASSRSAGVTGQVIESCGWVTSVAEGWRRGPTAGPIEQADEIDPIIRDLLAQSRSPMTVAEALQGATADAADSLSAY